MGFEPTFEISRCCAIPAQICGRLGVGEKMPIREFARFAQNNTVRVSDFVRTSAAGYLSVVPCHLNSTGMLTFETVPGLNFHVRTVLRTDLSSSGLPVLCAIEALVTLPLTG